ncbi:MAG: T9SS type A sorting domain-containing protein [Bacteroidota bacterium]
MKAKMILCLFIVIAIASFASHSTAQVRISGDTAYISGSTFSGNGFIGELDSTVSNDTTASGTRKDPNRVYALYEGQVYYQLTPMYFYNPTGTLTIVGVPDPNNPSAHAKPIVLLQPTGTTDVPANKVYGSITIKNVHWQVMELDGNLQSELFYCGTANQQPQELILDNDFFEFSNTDIFDCTNETGAIGGWPYGAKIFITNCYFRNMFEPGQWWSSRVFQCKHPIDTLWVENVTTSTGGLTFLQQNELTDFAYFNHNTIINNKKYWLLSPYHRNFFVTNNIFVNQNWVGEDTNVTNSGQDPDKLFMSTVNIDTNNTTNGLIVNKQWETQAGNDTANFSAALNLNKLQVYISNNIVFSDPLIQSGYYTNSAYVISDTGSPATAVSPRIPSYLGWFYAGAQIVGNIPGEWENSRTKGLLAAYAPPNGGMIEDNTTTPSTTPVTYGLTAAIVTAMAQWNQHQYGDSRFSTPTPALTTTGYIYGDYDPTTLPGIVGGAKTDAITNATTLAATDQVGISKFTDLTENFGQSSVTSKIDGFPVGSLIWDDTQNSSYLALGHNAELSKVMAAYVAAGGITSVKTKTNVATTFELSQNYPNPFNPSTQIDFSIPQQSNVQLKVYNTLGQLVTTLVNGNLSAGSHTVTFDARNLASGLYIYRLTAGNFSSVKKMMLLK